MAGQEPWKGKQVQGTATQPTTLLNTLGQVNTTAEVYPPSGQAAGAAGTLQWCSRLASRAHRAGSHGSQESRSVLPGQSWSTGPSPQGPIVLRIGIHHVAPSLVLPASLLPSSPSFIKKNRLSHNPRSEGSLFWCELESWKWSSLLERIQG